MGYRSYPPTQPVFDGILSVMAPFNPYDDWGGTGDVYLEAACKVVPVSRLHLTNMQSFTRPPYTAPGTMVTHYVELFSGAEFSMYRAGGPVWNYPESPYSGEWLCWDQWIDGASYFTDTEYPAVEKYVIWGWEIRWRYSGAEWLRCYCTMDTWDIQAPLNLPRRSVKKRPPIDRSKIPYKPGLWRPGTPREQMWEEGRRLGFLR